VTGTGAARALVAALPCWRGRVRAVPLPGGLSNRNFVVTDADGRRYVARVTGGDRPEHGIVRAREVEASLAAAAAGIGPPVIYAEPGVLVVARIPGRALTPRRLAGEPALLVRVAHLLRRTHEEVGRHVRGSPGAFWPFQIVRDYLGRLDETGRLAPEEAAWTALADRLEDAAGPTAMVFAHNDLMPGNLIDDGPRLWLIDWEFAGYGAALFDLAGVAVNNGLAAPARRALLASYFGRRPGRALLRRAAAFRLAAGLREILWGRVQALAPPLPGFDPVRYADRHAAAFRRALADFEKGRFA
jgi:thiamine kinase-like enzyme